MKQTTPDYALAYHRKWEVFLHSIRAAAEESGKKLSSKDEEKILDEWMRENYKSADETALCYFCQEEISRRLLAGEDLYQIPCTVRQQLEQFGIRLNRTRTRGK